MKHKLLGLLAGTALFSGLGAVVSQPGNAAAVQFNCVMNGGLPTTQAVNVGSGTRLDVVRWYSQYFSNSGYDAMTRCQQVSARFQSAFNSGRLNYVTAGIVNGYPVVCATAPGGGCNSGNVLFTLKQGQDAAATLQQLFDVRIGAAGPLYESEGRPYIDMNKLLAPVMATADVSPSEAPAMTPETSAPAATPTDAPPSSGGGFF